MDMMTIYAMGAAVLLVSIVAGSTGLFGTGICISAMIGVLMLLINALYWAHWIVAGIIVVVSVGVYLFLKNMVVA